MRITFPWNGQMYHADLSAAIDLSIPLRNGLENQPNAYGAPPYHASPVTAGDFVGSLEAGAPVNFFNIAINPHGNGTHTECVGHILPGSFRISQCFTRTHFVAELVSVKPEENFISRDQLRSAVRYKSEALIVRTLPNPESKKTRKYTGGNPPFFQAGALSWVAATGYQHLLTDLPSVDPEVDGGALTAHRAFWDADGTVRSEATITEMCYAGENIPDGLYLLDLQNLALDLDVSPSRPLLYVMEKHES